MGIEEHHQLRDPIGSVTQLVNFSVVAGRAKLLCRPFEVERKRIERSFLHDGHFSFCFCMEVEAGRQIASGSKVMAYNSVIE